MKIFDKNNNLIALLIRSKKNSQNKVFYSENEDLMQIGKFQLLKDDLILRHFHPKNPRKIDLTSEVLILQRGVLEVSLYDEYQNFVEKLYVYKNDILVLYRGGHEIKVVKKAKFIEIKQGPYDSNKDKVRF